MSNFRKRQIAKTLRAAYREPCSRFMWLMILADVVVLAVK